MNFVAIDFETATGQRHTACSVGLVMVKNGIIAHEYHQLIKPPDNKYHYYNTKVHGLTWKDTKDAPTFKQIYPQLKRRLQDNIIIAHNEKFDRSVLKATMEFYGLKYEELNLAKKWICTVEMTKKLGYKSSKLNECCKKHGIQLDHHEALSDARACAKLFLDIKDKKA